jgi:hypothetical protein
MTDSKVARYQLGVSAAALVTLILAAFALFFHAGGVAETVDTNAQTLALLSEIVTDHRSEIGHIGMVERVNGLKGDVSEIKDTVKSNSQSLQRIEGKLNGS